MFWGDDSVHSSNSEMSSDDEGAQAPDAQTANAAPATNDAPNAVAAQMGAMMGEFMRTFTSQFGRTMGEFNLPSTSGSQGGAQANVAEPDDEDLQGYLADLLQPAETDPRPLGGKTLKVVKKPWGFLTDFFFRGAEKIFLSFSTVGFENGYSKFLHIFFSCATK